MKSKMKRVFRIRYYNNEGIETLLASSIEELESHVCFSGKLKDVIIDSSRPFSFLVFDGQNWHKCPKSNNNRKVTRRNTNRKGNST